MHLHIYTQPSLKRAPLGECKRIRLTEVSVLPRCPSYRGSFLSNVSLWGQLTCLSYAMSGPVYLLLTMHILFYRTLWHQLIDDRICMKRVVGWTGTIHRTYAHPTYWYIADIAYQIGVHSNGTLFVHVSFWRNMFDIKTFHLESTNLTIRDATRKREGGARGASKGKKVLPKKHSLTLGYNEKKKQ